MYDTIKKKINNCTQIWRIFCLVCIFIICAIFVSMYRIKSKIYLNEHVQKCDYYNISVTQDNLSNLYDCTLYWKCDTTFDCVTNKFLHVNSFDKLQLFINSNNNTTHNFYVDSTVCIDVNNTYIKSIIDKVDIVTVVVTVVGSLLLLLVGFYILLIYSDIHFEIINDYYCGPIPTLIGSRYTPYFCEWFSFFFVIIVYVLVYIYKIKEYTDFNKNMQICKYDYIDTTYNNLDLYNFTLHWKCDTLHDCITEENLHFSSFDEFKLFINSNNNTIHDFYVNSTACTDVNNIYIKSTIKNFYNITVFTGCILIAVISYLCVYVSNKLYPKKKKQIVKIS